MSDGKSDTTDDVRTMDIARRIRHHGNNLGGLTGELFRLAADEIERLRSLLQMFDKPAAMRTLALRICQQTADAGAPPRCEEPCAWCLHEAREEMEEAVKGV